MSEDTQRRSDHQESPQRADQHQGGPPDPGSEESRNNPPPQWARTLNLVLLAFLIFYAVQWVSQSGSREISYNAFKAKVTSGQVAEVTIEGHQVRGAMKSEGESDDPSAREPFRTHIPEVGDTGIVPLLEDNGVTIKSTAGDPYRIRYGVNAVQSVSSAGFSLKRILYG